MSAHAFWATSGCQSLSLVGESVNHQMSTPAKSSVTAPTLPQNGLTNTKAIAAASARSPATTLFALPNGASNHTAPNAQATAIMAVRRTSSAPIQRMTRTRSTITSAPNDRGEEHGFRTGSLGLGVECQDAVNLGDGFRV